MTKNNIYLAGVKLLADKYIKTYNDKRTKLRRLNEGLEYTFEIWSNECIEDKSVREDVWSLVKDMIINGKH